MTVEPANKVKGKYCVLVTVENLGETEETQTLLEAANDEVTYGGDEEVLESDDQLGVEITQREVIGGAPFIETGHLLTPDNEVLEATGVFGSDGKWTTAKRSEEAVRILAYEDSDLDELELVIEGVDVEPEWSDDVSLPTDDYGEGGVTFHCNGGLSTETGDLAEYDVFAE